MNIKVWVSETVAQDYLCLKRTSLWKLRSRGDVIYSKIGRRTLYYLPSLDGLIKMNSTINLLPKLVQEG